jgi:hypothetical protein
MRSQSRRRWAALNAIGAGALMALSIGLSGCAFLDVGEGRNVADVYEDFAGFCGFLQDCGGNDSNRGGQQTATGSSSSSSSSNSGNSSTVPTGD